MRQCLLMTVTDTSLHKERCICEEEHDDDDIKNDLSKMQKVTCCGLHDRGTERNG